MFGYDALRAEQQADAATCGDPVQLGIGVSTLAPRNVRPRAVRGSSASSATAPAAGSTPSIRMLATGTVEVVTGVLPPRPGPRDGVEPDRRRLAVRRARISSSSLSCTIRMSSASRAASARMLQGVALGLGADLVGVATTGVAHVRRLLLGQLEHGGGAAAESGVGRVGVLVAARRASARARDSRSMTRCSLLARLLARPDFSLLELTHPLVDRGLVVAAAAHDGQRGCGGRRRSGRGSRGREANGERVGAGGRG